MKLYSGLALALILVAEIASARASLRIMPLGDSITQGDPKRTPGSYRTFLYEQLTLDKFEFVFVGSKDQGPPNLPQRHHEGHSGWRIDNLMYGRTYGTTYEPGLDSWFRTEHPDLILLMIGTNDIVQNFDLDSALDRYSQLLKSIWTKVPCATILVSSLIPTNNDPNNQKILDFNRKLFAVERSLERTHGQIHWVDMYNEAKVSWTTGDLIDGVHPSQKGYKKIAKIWKRHIAKLQITGCLTFLTRR